VAFAVVLIFMQLGFLGAVSKTATMIFDAMDFDIALRSPAYLHLSEPRWFPRVRVEQAASLPMVASAKPLYVAIAEWQAPPTGEWRGILAFGTNPHDPGFTLPEIREQAGRLVQPQFVLIDRKTQPDYGPANGHQFGDDDVGVETDMTRRRVRIVGHFELGTGLAANGAVMLSEEGFDRVTEGQTIDDVSLGLIRLVDGADKESAKDALKQHFAAHPDVEILTREEVLDLERKRWVSDTSLGTIFQIGVVVSLFVGTAIVYQVLSTDIANMMSEYATLKAMGYSAGYLARVVIQQAVILAVIGFLPALVVSIGLYAVTGAFAHLPMVMTVPRAFGVLGLSILMCTVSGLAAIRKMRTADPADLF
jgi:putative ABC transport system permease protein